MKMSTTSFPQGWFYIACAHRPDHVLTVANMTMQVKEKRKFIQSFFFYRKETYNIETY